MPHNVASDLGLHCLPVTLFSVSRPKNRLIVNEFISFVLSRIMK